MCRAAEQTDIRMRAMEMATTSPPHTEAVHAVAKQHSRQNQWKQSNPPRTGDTDDILVVGCGDTDKEAKSDHDAKLVALMECCREVKLRLGLKKLQFKVAEVQFHGHILSSARLKPDPEKQEQEDVQHVNQADYLNVSSQRLEQIRRHTDRDECLQALKNTVLVGWPDVKEEAPLIAREYWPFRDEISVQNGVLFRGQKVIIPKSLRPEMLTCIHSSHIGGEACYRHAQETLYWPNMQTEIKDFFTRFTSEWEFEHVTSSPRHPKANGKAKSAVKIVKNLLRKAAHDGDDPWKAILHWRNTPTENMGSSPAQRLMSRRLNTSIPATYKLLEPVIMVGVTEKLRHRKQLAKSFYDRSAWDFPELEVGETVRMKPLPGDNTGHWRVGTCLHRVAPRSYLVDVDGSLYQRNRVDLRVAKPTARATDKTDGPEAAHAPEAASAPETAAEAPPTVTEPSPVRSTPKAPSSPVGAPPSDGHTYTRVGRLSKPPLRLTM
ncbi:hypothetical protein AAFF_G00192810 [Aldrovandia affinis]|uniref:Gypsy retrotransposon integrase-like protein 1 n=1 Tax=Aldrovandia affinis TaxID=143900 RepID=A0AAD7W6F5_9TELE|nr:hypothetical protein AAFF_G00192810 [Aldrovandia affinis]